MSEHDEPKTALAGDSLADRVRRLRDEWRSRAEYGDASLAWGADALDTLLADVCAAATPDHDALTAQIANLEADYDRRGERLWRLAALAGHEPNPADNDAVAEMVIRDALASPEPEAESDDWGVGNADGGVMHVASEGSARRVAAGRGASVYRRRSAGPWEVVAP